MGFMNLFKSKERRELDAFDKTIKAAIKGSEKIAKDAAPIIARQIEADLLKYINISSDIDELESMAINSKTDFMREAAKRRLEELKK